MARDTESMPGVRFNVQAAWAGATAASPSPARAALSEREFNAIFLVILAIIRSSVLA